MAKIPKKVLDRFSKQIGSFQRILSDARDRDVNESDTVTIIADMLGSLFGFDKYLEVTSEQAIRATYCDLAVKLEGSIKYLIEVKAIGLTLKENHLRQAINYGANQGIPWVVLTNGITWNIYAIKFEKPISEELVCSFDFLELNHRQNDDAAKLYLLCKEGLAKAAIEEFHHFSQLVNKFTLAALICSDSVTNLLRRELKRLEPGMKVSAEDIQTLLPDVLKREVMEGDIASQARRRIKRSSNKPKRQTKSTDTKKDVSPPNHSTGED